MSKKKESINNNKPKYLFEVMDLLNKQHEEAIATLKANGFTVLPPPHQLTPKYKEAFNKYWKEAYRIGKLPEYLDIPK